MPETIGQQLKQAREARNLTLSKVTQATHIQTRLIEAMEADDFESLPSPVQARAFLRLYAEFLGLSLDDLIARQRLTIGEVSTSFPEAIPVPGKNPKQVFPDELPEPASEAGTDRSLPVRLGKLKTLIAHLRKSLPQPKDSPEPAKSARQKPLSEPVPTKRVESEAARTKKNLPGEVADDVEEVLPPEIASSRSRSQAIFAGIGEALHLSREALSLTFDEIEQHTHVRKHYLQALEVGNFDHLPSSVQARGMLSSFAHFLDMDVDAILMQYAEGLQIQRLERQPAPVKERSRSKAKSQSTPVRAHSLQRYLSMDVFVGVGLVLVLLVFAFWGTSRIIGLRSASTPQPTAQSISDILAAATEPGTPTPSPTNAPGTGVILPEVSSTAIVTLPAAGQGPVQVVLIALDQAFVRVTVDGKKAFEGRVVAGTAYPFDGNGQIEILTGNGAAVSILFNQSDLGPMGSLGQVVNRIYTTNAILNPTATFTPTATITPIYSLTPTPTLTPSITPLSGSTVQPATATQEP